MESRRLWSLWDMSINFLFSIIDSVLTELGLQVTVSRKNADYFAFNGIARLNDPEARESMRQSVECVDYIIKIGDKIFPQFNCPHIDHSMRLLNNWRNDSDRDWQTLHMRSVALRDSIKTELKEYYFYQYPKEKGRKLVAWKKNGGHPSQRSQK